MIHAPHRVPPFKHGTAKIGGSYNAVGQLGPYYNMATGSIIFSLRWTDPDYFMAITGFGSQMAFVAPFTAAQLLGLVTYKLTNYTVEDTGGTSILSVFGTRRSENMHATCVAAVKMATADIVTPTPGSTPLGAGTRTVGNVIYGEAVDTGTTSRVPKAGSLIDLPIAQCKHEIIGLNEGIEIRTAGALPASYANGMFIPQVILDWMEIPNELRDEYEGGLVYA
jgi:hypothetical protein